MCTQRLLIYTLDTRTNLYASKHPSRFQVQKGASRLLHRPVNLDLNVHRSTSDPL